MPVHGREELDRKDAIVRAGTSASLMSDTKWRKLFVAFSNAKLHIVQYTIKLLNSSQGYVSHFPPGLHPPQPWFDCIVNGPTPFRTIEWVLFPSIAKHEGTPTRYTNQDINAAAEVLVGLGQFPFEVYETGLLVRGYLMSRTSLIKPFVDNIR